MNLINRIEGQKKMQNLESNITPSRSTFSVKRICEVNIWLIKFLINISVTCTICIVSLCHSPSRFLSNLSEYHSSFTLKCTRRVVSKHSLRRRGVYWSVGRSVYKYAIREIAFSRCITTNCSNSNTVRRDTHGHR